MFKPGDTVHLTRDTSDKWAGTYTVVKVNPTTYGLTDSVGRKVKAAHTFVNAGPMPALDQFAAPGVTFDLAKEKFFLGEVVTAKGLRNIGTDVLFVVLAEAGRGYRIARLGGDRDLYYTGIPARNLTRARGEWKA